MRERDRCAPGVCLIDRCRPALNSVGGAVCGQVDAGTVVPNERECTVVRPSQLRRTPTSRTLPRLLLRASGQGRQFLAEKREPLELNFGSDVHGRRWIHRRQITAKQNQHS